MEFLSALLGMAQYFAVHRTGKISFQYNATSNDLLNCLFHTTWGLSHALWRLQTTFKDLLAVCRGSEIVVSLWSRLLDSCDS